MATNTDSQNQLVSGIIQVLQSPLSIFVLSIANPFFIFDTFDFMQVLPAITNIEVQQRSKPEHKRLRIKLFGQYGYSKDNSQRDTLIQTDVRTDMITGKIVSSQLRDRSDMNVPVSGYFFISAIIVAFNEPIRNKFISELFDGDMVPSIYFEFLKKTRKSSCGIFNITPQLDIPACKKFIELFPNFKDTFIDVDFYNTQGIRTLINTFNFIYSEAPDYLLFIEASKIKSLSWFSHEATTFNGITVDGRFIQILQHNNYPKGTPSFVNMVDAWIVDLHHLKDNIRTKLTFSYAYEILSLDYNMVAQHLVQRVLGIQLNGEDDFDKEKEKSEDEKPRQEDKPAEKPVPKGRSKKGKGKNFNPFSKINAREFFQLIEYILKNPHTRRRLINAFA